MTVTARIDVSDTVKSLTDLERKQLPFAKSLMVNMLGNEFQAAERKHFSDVFTVRQATFLNREGVKRISPAATKNNPTVTFGVTDRADFLTKFEDGQTKTARSGGNVIVPDAVRRNKKDIVTKANRPRALLANKNKPGTGGVFYLKKKTGNLIAGLYQRTGRGGATLKRLFIGTPQAKTPKVLKFHETAERIVKTRADAVFQKALEQAVRTAK